MNLYMRKVTCHDLQFDEIWTYVLMKEKQKVRRNITSDRIGDAYCFTAFERDTKLLLTWHLCRRTETDTVIFVQKVFDVSVSIADSSIRYTPAMAAELQTRSGLLKTTHSIATVAFLSSSTKY